MEILKFGDSPTPKRSNNNGNQRKPAAMIVAGVLVAMMGMSTTLAGTISISGNRVEFGQGLVTTAACDGTIDITPATTFKSDNGGGSDSFTVTSITLDSITVAAPATTGTSGCLGQWMTLKAYAGTQNATALPFISATGVQTYGIQFQIPASDGNTQGNWGTNSKPSGITFDPSNWTSNGTNGTIKISGFTLTQDVTRFTIESSGSQPTLS